MDDIKEDTQMVEKATAIIERLESFHTAPLNDEMLMIVLKTQSLVEEIYTDGRSS